VLVLVALLRRGACWGEERRDDRAGGQTKDGAPDSAPGGRRRQLLEQGGETVEDHRAPPADNGGMNQSCAAGAHQASGELPIRATYFMAAAVA
jgi:hypothetical protein